MAPLKVFFEQEISCITETNPAVPLWRQFCANLCKTDFLRRDISHFLENNCSRPHMCICIFGHQQIQFSDKYKESTLSQILYNFRCWTTQIHHGEIEDNYKLLRFPDFGKSASRPVCPSLDFPRWSLPSPLVIPAWPDSRLGRTSHDVDGGGGGGVNVKAAKKLAALAEPIV